MSDTRNAKRKADEIEAVPNAEQDIKKRAKKDEEEVEGVVETGGTDEEDDVDPDELAALDTSNVIEGGRRTRGVRVDYSKMKFDEEEELELQGEEEDESQGEDDGVDGEDKAAEGNEEETQNIEKEANGYDDDEEEGEEEED